MFLKLVINKNSGSKTFSGFLKFYQTVDSLMILWCHSFCSGPFINYVDMAWVRGVCILLHKPYLAKWSTKGEGVKNIQITVRLVYGWPLSRFCQQYFLWNTTTLIIQEKEILSNIQSSQVGLNTIFAYCIIWKIPSIKVFARLL